MMHEENKPSKECEIIIQVRTTHISNTTTQRLLIKVAEKHELAKSRD